MTQTQIKNSHSSQLQHELVNRLIETVLPQFESQMKKYVMFNMLFLTLGIVECLFLLVFFALLAKTAVLAFSLSVVFLTFFAYFILRLYFQSKKTEQLHEAKDLFVTGCKSLLNYQEGVPEHFSALSKACCRFADSLHLREYMFYPELARIPFLAPYMEKFSCWWHWEDIFQMKELLLKASVGENVKLVISEPTSLQAHASLANAYVMLSGHYTDPRHIEGFDEERWIPKERYNAEMERNFRKTAEKAIEEFKILNYYAPDDAWVHAQLAFSYRDLKMPQEEIKEYEAILKINPDDHETLYKLGVLYFQQGWNAQALKIYEDLKRFNPAKADALMKFYGN